MTCFSMTWISTEIRKVRIGASIHGTQSVTVDPNTGELGISNDHHDIIVNNVFCNAANVLQMAVLCMIASKRYLGMYLSKNGNSMILYY